MKDRIAAPWLAIGWLGAVLLPWHMIDAGFFAFGWLKGYPGPESGPAIWQIAVAGEWWLLPSLLPLLAATWAVWRGDERMPDLLVQAGITGIVPHDLRRTYASHLIMNGADLRTVQKLLGHTSLVMIDKHYGHLANSQLIVGASKVYSLRTITVPPPS